MLKLFRKSKNLILAVDIGHRNTKFLIVSKSGGNKIKLMKAVKKPTPVDSFKNGSIIHEDNLADFISKTVAEMELLEEVEVVAGFSGKSGLITKKIDIPKIELDQVPEHLPFEVEQYLPYDMNDLDLDYEILHSSKAREPNTIPIFVVAVLIKAVSEYDNLFSKAFLTCNIIDVNVLALSNIFEWSYGKDQKKTFLLLDVGDSHTNMSVIDTGEVVFTRSISAGGAIYTEKISNKLQLDFQEAEDLKVNKTGQPEEVKKSILDTHALFCDEIYTGYESFKTFFPQTELSSLFVTGGGIQTEGMLSSLEKKFSLPVNQIDSLKNVEGISDLTIKKEELSLYFSVALGIALRALV